MYLLTEVRDLLKRPETGPVTTVDRTTVIKINESIEAFKAFDQSLNDKDQYALYVSKC
jgi:hypothetical protein